MDAGLTIRPTATVAESALARPEPVPVRTAVATTLAPSKSVTATRDSGRSAGHDSAQHQLQQQKAQQAQMKREVLIDSQTREVIFRVIDVRNGQIDHQVPDEALLRLRAYNRAMTRGESPSDDGKGSEA